MADLRTIRPFLAAFLSLWAALLVAAGAAASPAAWEALRQPGAVAMMRHALAPGTGDPAGFRLGDCATQRNLSDAGRAQAGAIGRAFRQNGIEIDRVLTSEWCRSRETAELLGLGPVEEFQPLNSFFRDRGKGAGQTERLRAFLAGRSGQGALLLVTHQVNITALTEVYPASGEVVVVEMDEDGRVEVAGKISIRP
ncbi:histidine phosphatase family protein [Afifella pfennigii]|uniref:histidine phosphatase family protein n=1 Tax=Afifella pfennigii TaxID=209897 RepID=UPI001AEC1F1C|nr:histidine phosphatase family protein [Afifella pfennigii]